MTDIRSEAPTVELRVMIDGQEAFGLLGGDAIIGCSDADRDLVLSAISEALVTLCGVRPRSEAKTIVRVERLAPDAVLRFQPRPAP